LPCKVSYRRSRTLTIRMKITADSRNARVRLAGPIISRRQPSYHALCGALTNPVDGVMLFFKVDSARLRQWKTSQRMTHTQKGV